MSNGSIVASEVDADLAVRARQNLASYPNVSVHAGDGTGVDPGVCDAILINAGVTHPHRPWLADGWCCRSRSPWERLAWGRA
jgi:protein-L-isoaspartate(D-aspartate) O-methyltransferase